MEADIKIAPIILERHSSVYFHAPIANKSDLFASSGVAANKSLKSCHETDTYGFLSTSVIPITITPQTWWDD